MRQIMFCFFWGCCILPTLAQHPNIQKIETANPLFPDHQYQFPLLNLDDSMMNDKINSSLVADFLEIKLGEEKVSIFENVWATQENQIPPLNDLAYKIQLLNSKIYSLTLSAEACGAYCENFDLSYNYDVQTGKKINADTLFSEKGKASILELLKRRKAKKMVKYLDEIADSLASKNLSDDDEARYLKMQELYNNCIKEDYLHSLNYLDIRISKNTMTIILSRCSSHANRAIDELGSFEFTFILADIREWLSPYGLELLLE